MAKTNNFQETIEKHLIDFKKNKQYLPPTNKKEWLYHDMTDGIFPPIKHGFLQYAYNSGMPLHDYVNHVRSSQMFCINLFFHLIKNEPDVLLKVLSKESKKLLVELNSYEFEFSASSNILGEWKSNANRPEEYITATDLFIVAIDNNDQRVGFLIEVKFSEVSFTKCGGYSSNGNVSTFKNACDNSILLFKDFKTCYLHGANGLSNLSRTYLDYFHQDDFHEESFKNKCPFIHNHQCIRNHALLRALISENVIDNGFFVLVSHDLNKSIEDEWGKFMAILQGKAINEVLKINASNFVRSSSCTNYKKYFFDRYLIE